MSYPAVLPWSGILIKEDSEDGCDFLHDDIEKVAQANIVATIIDGKEVYKA